MFRKLALALGATLVLGAAALTPTAAFAGWHGHGYWGHGFTFGIYAPTYVAAPDCYVVKRTIELPDGSLRVRRFTVCD